MVTEWVYQWCSCLPPGSLWICVISWCTLGMDRKGFLTPPHFKFWLVDSWQIIKTPNNGREGKRYLRVYIQIRFRHACHETRDRQSRSLVSGQEEGWGEVKVLLKFWIQLRSMSGLLKKTQNKICLLKSKFEVICEQFWRAVKRMSVRLFIKKNSNNKFWTLFRKILKSD